MAHQKISLPIQLLYPDVEIPTYGSIDASGFDLKIHHFKQLYAQNTAERKFTTFTQQDQSTTLYPNDRILVGCGFNVAVPTGYEMQVRSRSGLALKEGLIVANAPGTVDADYRGEIGVILINTSRYPIELKKGDRVAQAILVPVVQAEFGETSELPQTDRGTGGYGSTGK